MKNFRFKIFNQINKKADKHRYHSQNNTIIIFCKKLRFYILPAFFICLLIFYTGRIKNSIEKTGLP